MTIAASYGLLIPNPVYIPGQLTGPSTNSFLMDATAEKVAWVFSAPQAGNLARVLFRTGAVTTGDTLKVSFQDVDLTTGNPDGTPDQFRTQAVADTDDTVWLRTALVSSDGTDGGSKRAVVAGERVAVVMEFNSYVAGNLNLVGAPVSGTRGPFVGTHYLTHFTAAWAKSLTTMPLGAIEYDDGSFAFLPAVFPGIATNLSVSTGTTPDEAGLIITIPYNARVWGAWVSASLAGDADLVLYDTDGTTVLGSGSFDKDVSSLSGQVAAVQVMFTAAPTIKAGSSYRLVLKPTTATAVAMPYYDVHTTPGAAILDQMDGGQDIHWTQRTDAGAWSETTTRRAVMGLMLSGLDASRGGHFRQVISKRHRRLAG